LHLRSRYEGGKGIDLDSDSGSSPMMLKITGNQASANATEGIDERK
jgi:hypothetical protein